MVSASNVIEIHEPRPIIMIGTPYYKGFEGRYVLSLAQTIYDLYPKYRVALATAEGGQIHVNRNKIWEIAYKNKADFLLYVDTDMIWETAYVEKLIDSGKDVIGGLATTRKSSKETPQRICVYENDGTGRCKPIKEVPNVPFRCWAIGAAFLLLSKNIVRQVWEEKHKHGYPFDPIQHYVAEGKSNITSDYLGEDISFCWRLRKLGIDIWCDPSVRPGHIGELVYGIPDKEHNG